MKKIFTILFFLLLTFSSPVFAHTGLKDASPSEGETVTEELQEITMEFNTAIENGSLFTLLDENGIEVAFEDIRLDKNKLIGTTSEPLIEGRYTVNWSIVGEDGHLIKGEYAFTVAQDNKAGEDSGTTDELKEKSNELNATDKTEEEANQSSAVNKEEKSKTNPSIVISIVTGFLLFAAFQTAMWLIRRGKK
ncbi:copper resistance CopC family protein [Bacillus thermotolerans]|uniref:Copper resistance protein CopC n=1 Tax=Bacillus thermotolerans TaxID=1221996 RepID=A0A0F5HPF0_BACTR|nr:copper resistance CopC family protein [Bacillus thermotolerans]KKB34712.1 Copper resistance protein CopC [Bacillus thermotolerans]KKB38773.1 Copper resistance protein CopC [Bacillus thermotolerans]